MIKPYECTQCGSTEFEDVGAKRVRCTHCGSLFQVLTSGPTVEIAKGANVTFGKNAHVVIHGEVDIQGGANVDIQGDVVVQKGKKRKRFFKLKLISPGGESKKTPAD